MFRIAVSEKGAGTRTFELDKTEVTIGSAQGNDIVFEHDSISRRHARLLIKDGKFIVIDMQSTNGTFVNGRRLTAPQVVRGQDKITIGEHTLWIVDGARPSMPPNDPPPEPILPAARRTRGTPAVGSRDAPGQLSLDRRLDEIARRLATQLESRLEQREDDLARGVRSGGG